MSLKDLNYKNEYYSLDHDVAKEFYVPALSEAKSYKRAVGYFSSSILTRISRGVSQLAKNGGTIQIIASPNLSDEDIDAINKGYKSREELIKNALLSELKDTKTYNDTNRLNLLANLISDGIMDIKIAYMKSDNLPSRHVAERNGMKFVKAFTKTVMGKVVEDEVLYMKDL